MVPITFHKRVLRRSSRSALAPSWLRLGSELLDLIPGAVSDHLGISQLIALSEVAAARISGIEARLAFGYLVLTAGASLNTGAANLVVPINADR